jgi:hypothetical protein
MTLKVIVAGLGRTGTHSTQVALNQLGFRCYHMVEVIRNKENKSHLDFWRTVANSPGSRQDWEQVFSKYTATVDFPACAVWRELMEAYPDAKVLLTLHPKGPGAWYDSVLETIYFTENKWQFKVLQLLTPFGRKFGDMLHKLAWERTLEGAMPDRTKAIAGTLPGPSGPRGQTARVQGQRRLGSALRVSRRPEARHAIPERQRPRRFQEEHRRDVEGRLCDSGRHRRGRSGGDRRGVLGFGMICRAMPSRRVSNRATRIVAERRREHESRIGCDSP